MALLSDHFHIRRRYMRSVNLERDSELADSLEGYVLTPRALQTFERVLDAYAQPNVTRAWTLTGVYGTGKSAFANFLAAIFAPGNSQVRPAAESLVAEQDDGVALAEKISTEVPEEGLVRAIVTARREPLAHSLIRAIGHGAEEYWSSRRGRKPGAVEDAMARRDSRLAGEEVSTSDLAELAQGVAEASGTGLLIVVDELGKLLEHAARTGGAEDLFLLQQLAELPAGPEDPPVLLVGILHQAFSEYGHLLSAAERAEWEKIQGRFEDVPFSESPDQLIRLMAEAIQADLPSSIQERIRDEAAAWHDNLASTIEQDYLAELLPAQRIADIYPIHPVAALALPALCTRYGQHDRSLFTFLASGEPNALGQHLEEHQLSEDCVPLLQLPTVYDYFIDSARIGATGRVQLHRWAEVHGAIREAAGLDADELAALKVIGTLNLVSSSGPLRARRDLVLSALTPHPGATNDVDHWRDVLASLVDRRIITYRQQVDEYRIWQGSDFDIDAAIESRLEAEQRPLAELLHEAAPLSPTVAQRHSYQTGTLRFFERRYVDSEKKLHNLAAQLDGSAGVVAYWVGEEMPADVPETTTGRRPVAVTVVERTPALVSATRELLALEQIHKKEPALQTDGVARKEVGQRVDQAREVLDDVLRNALGDTTSLQSWFGGTASQPRNYNAALSDLCDEAYSEGPVLWNEIINRRDLTSQGARAQRELITALLENHEEPRLGIEGTGPEYSIYSSLLENTGIHREEDGEWVIGPPQNAGVEGVWNAIETFCLNSTEEPRAISELFETLESPPYGATAGILPVFLAAILIYHSDDVSLYQEGTFSPTLTPPQFELLVKHPDRFAVKYFELKGIRWELFKELETVVKAKGAKRPEGVRNATLLTVVRPLVQFAASLPDVTRKARDLSEHARAVLEALLSGREPDELIFRTLPEALGQEPFDAGQEGPPNRHEQFRQSLFATLRELQQHYENVLENVRDQIHEAFGVRAGVNNVREDLRVRASYMVGRVIDRRMKALVTAAVDKERSDREWLESLAMIIADRPASNWTPENRAAFELNLGEFARKFRNLEAIQRGSGDEDLEGFEAKRITITEASGKETHRLVWVNKQDKQKIERVAREILSRLSEIEDEHLRQAVLTTIVEHGLRETTEEHEPDIEPADAGGRKRKHG